MEKIKAGKRRVKIVYLPYSFVVRVLKGLDSGDYFKVPTFEGLPDDIEVLNIFASPEHDGFGFTIRHPSFEEMSAGCIVPELALSEMVFRKVKVKRIGGD